MITLRLWDRTTEDILRRYQDNIIEKIKAGYDTRTVNHLL